MKLGAGETVTARVLRKLVAKKAGLSETNVARLKHINQHLEPELKEAMEVGKIGISVANELARMKPEEQQMAAKQINAGEKITLRRKKRSVKADRKAGCSRVEKRVRIGHNANQTVKKAKRL